MEDQIGFPHLWEELPDAPCDLLTRRHQGMMLLIDETLAAVQAVAGGQPDATLRDGQRTTTRIMAIWHPHIRTEEEHFAARRLESLISLQQHIRLNDCSAGTCRSTPNLTTWWCRSRSITCRRLSELSWRELCRRPSYRSWCRDPGRRSGNPWRPFFLAGELF